MHTLGPRDYAIKRLVWSIAWDNIAHSELVARVEESRGSLRSTALVSVGCVCCDGFSTGEAVTGEQAADSEERSPRGGDGNRQSS